MVAAMVSRTCTPLMGEECALALEVRLNVNFAWLQIPRQVKWNGQPSSWEPQPSFFFFIYLTPASQPTNQPSEAWAKSVQLSIFLLGYEDTRNWQQNLTSAEYGGLPAISCRGCLGYWFPRSYLICLTMATGFELSFKRSERLCTVQPAMRLVLDFCSCECSRLLMDQRHSLVCVIMENWATTS